MTKRKFLFFLTTSFILMFVGGYLSPAEAQTGGKVNPLSDSLRVYVEIMREEVNKYEEAAQDVWMDYNLSDCTCRFFIGENFKKSTKYWLVPLLKINSESIHKLNDPQFPRIEFQTLGDSDDIEYYEDRSLVHRGFEFNLYLDPIDKWSFIRFEEAMRNSIRYCHLIYGE